MNQLDELLRRSGAKFQHRAIQHQFLAGERV